MIFDEIYSFYWNILFERLQIKNKYVGYVFFIVIKKLINVIPKLELLLDTLAGHEPLVVQLGLVRFT